MNSYVFLPLNLNLALELESEILKRLKSQPKTLKIEKKAEHLWLSIYIYVKLSVEFEKNLLKILQSITIAKKTKKDPKRPKIAKKAKKGQKSSKSVRNLKN